MDNAKTKVVVVGGGNGSALTIRALKPYSEEFELSAVISMSDSGGSSGVLREQFHTLPPGDLLRAVLAFSPHDYAVLKKIFYQNRFSGLNKLAVGSGSRGHNLGNLFLVLLAAHEGNFMRAVGALEEAVEASGRTFPVTEAPTDLCVELANKQVVKTEGLIDRPNYNRSLKIKRAWLEPFGAVAPQAAAALRAADFIICSPGSLYTSVVATLLPRGVREAIAASPARLVYVAGDAYELHGETGPDRLSDFVKQIEHYLPRPVDTVIYNDHELDETQKATYRAKNWGVFAKDPEFLSPRQVIGADFERPEGGLLAEKLGPILKNVIEKAV